MQFSSEADVHAMVERAQSTTQRAREAGRAALRRLDVIQAFADDAAARLEKVQAMPIRQHCRFAFPGTDVLSESSNGRPRSNGSGYSRKIS
jgi:hypothetical protein